MMQKDETSQDKAAEFIKKVDFAKGDGLVPVIVQDERTKDILMLAYANKEALTLSFTTGVAHYWSRSRASMWKKGETSGNIQKIKRIDTDCDQDTILYVVEQNGVACHTGDWPCFPTVTKEKSHRK
ncbi:MAG TPA: phosphoribosyl-AMP cyclohydrolase [Nitrososphaerales archaeon]|nr:phosphoribosyl-AMP cyclohydrolase [Nitrososphaerales archaeon]